MFMDLEKILPNGVRLLSIEPAHEKGRVYLRLQVAAISDEAKLQFLPRAGEFSGIQGESGKIDERYSEHATGKR